jgi:hypothetical protein
VRLFKFIEDGIAKIGQIFKSDIVDFAHSHFKSNISDFAHDHTVSEITDFPEIPSGELDNWTESTYTNSGKEGSKLTPNSATTNVDAVIQPKGTGAIIAQQPDGTTAGGNNRGNYAVDLQMSRAYSTDVASGAKAAILGGEQNRASGESSVVIGSGNVASGLYALALGFWLSITHHHATGIGFQGKSKNNYEVSICSNNVQRNFNSAAITTNNYMPIDVRQLLLFRINVLAKKYQTDDVHSETIRGCIYKGANNASTAIKGGLVAEIFANDITPTYAVTADTTNGGLAITVTGIAATQISHFFEIEYSITSSSMD